MRVAIVGSRFPVLSETFVLAQVTGLLDRGHDVTVLAGRPTLAQRAHDDVMSRYSLEARTRYWPTKNETSLWLRGAQAMVRGPRRTLGALTRCVGRTGGNQLALRALSVSAERPFDAIVCHFGNVAREVEQLRDVGALRGPLAAVFHAHELTVLLKRHGPQFYAPLFASAECMMPVSKHWARKLEALGCPAHKIVVHHMGVDCESLSFSERPLPQAHEPLKLVSVARLVEKKGIAYAVEAVVRLANEGVPISYRIVGDGPLRAELEQQLETLGGTRHVAFLGARPHREVVALLDDSHVMLAPSVTARDGDMEGIPVSIMEAMARGLVVVSTEHSGIPELVQDGVSGKLVAERDVDALAQVLRELSAHPERWAALAQGGRRVVEQRFNQRLLDDELEIKLRQLSSDS